MNNKHKILVTGGAGFIGSNLVDALINMGHEVVLIDNMSTGKVENINTKAKFYNCDIRYQGISKIFEEEKFDIVYHMAAQIDVQASLKDPVNDESINIGGTINILKNCGDYGVKKIIYSSTAAAYGNPQYLPIDEKHIVAPISFYGISKTTPEMYIRVMSDMYGFEYTILRYSNVYGIRQDPKGEGGVIAVFMDRLFNGEDITIFGDGSSTRDYINVNDIVQANISAMNLGSGNVYNIGTGRFINIESLANKMVEKINDKSKIIHGNERKGDIKESYFKIDKAMKELNWRPETVLEDGLELTINHYKRQNERA